MPKDFVLFLAFIAALVLIGFGALKYAYAFGRASLGAEISYVCAP